MVETHDFRGITHSDHIENPANIFGIFWNLIPITESSRLCELLQ